MERERISIYQAMVASGVPCHNHESDLYVPANAQTREILARYPVSKANVQTFINRVEGGVWFDIPFAYEPWWVARESKAGRGVGVRGRAAFYPELGV